MTQTGTPIRCRSCHNVFVRPHNRGPVPVYCSGTCRQRGYRDRRLKRDGRYRIALRLDSDGVGTTPPSKWTESMPPLDDIVVKRVSMFRMEDMGDHWWMCCYLGDGADAQSIHFDVRRGRKGEQPIVVTATALPDVIYEGED